MSRNRNCRITTAVRKNPIPNLCNIGHVVSSIETHLMNPRGPTSKLGEQYAMLQSGDCWKHFRMNSKIYKNMRQTSHNTSKLAWLKDVLVSTGCPLPTSLLFNIIALYSAISANPPQPNCQDTPEQYGAGTIHMLNKSIRGKKKKAVAKQRNNSMPVTILPSLCGSRMCWSAQDVLCQQVLLFNIIALNFAISANPPQPNCQDTPEQYGAGTIHMLNKSIRGKEKKAVAKQRNNSMPVTILPSLCGSRMCWSAQDVLCQQVYFSTSLPSILPSLQILPNLIVKGSLNEKLPSSGV